MYHEVNTGLLSDWQIGSRIAARQLQMPQEQQKEKEMRIQHWVRVMALVQPDE